MFIEERIPSCDINTLPDKHVHLLSMKREITELYVIRLHKRMVKTKTIKRMNNKLKMPS